jgi:hypothetical protein
LLRTAHWVRLANEPKVTFAAVVDSKTGDNALTGAEKPKMLKSRKKTDGIAMIAAGLLKRRRRTNMEPPLKSLQFYHLLVANN